MQLNLTEAGKQTDQAVEISDSVFAAPYNESLVHQLIVAYQNAARQGTSAQKTRSEVRGGGAKPWRQKGTGRARAGTSRGPIWRSGGATFASKTRSYAQKLNKKMYRAGMRSIFSELVRSNRLLLVDTIKLPAPKTKEMVSYLKEQNIEDVLVLTDELDDNLYLASRNLPNVDVRDYNDVDPVSLLAYKHLLVTKDAMKKIEERLQ